MDREVALHFRDQLREARAVALKDAEAFEQVVFVFERIGVYLTGSIKTLAGYAEPLAQEAVRSPLATSIPSVLPDWHAHFSTLYSLVRMARNDALHEGAYARHLTTHAVELSVILEDALMTDAFCARDFMVRDPVCAYTWQPISSIRRSMLANSFSFLPVAIGRPDSTQWKLLSDYSIAAYLRGAEGASERNRRLARKLSEVVDQDGIRLVDAPVCAPEDSVTTVLERSQGRPVLVIGLNRELWGIITPFDVI
ncbi:MAG: hypothetical protein HY695_21395 [Deltaproteobacteria bacterium]|nr:hypothetical protein [Deltaproteobacteria bacterium]